MLFNSTILSFFPVFLETPKKYAILKKCNIILAKYFNCSFINFISLSELNPQIFRFGTIKSLNCPFRSIYPVFSVTVMNFSNSLLYQTNKVLFTRMNFTLCAFVPTKCLKQNINPSFKSYEHFVYRSLPGPCRKNRSPRGNIVKAKKTFINFF